MRSPSAVLFDAYGTLFDVHSVAALAESFFAGQGQALSVLWRDKQIEYSRLVTTSDDGAHYQPFSELTRAGLRYACQRLALDLTAEREAALMAQYPCLTPYPEVREVLDALRTRTLWINRFGLPREAIGPAPERTGSSLRDVLSFF